MWFALGVPTMRDRAEQALAKLALEPEWEAHFEPHSYGFRPGRSAHDAIQAIFNAVYRQPKYVLDADIARCFDRINHQDLLEKLNTFPSMRRAIRAWLKAGVMEEGELFPTKQGTPQGGVISPLLANIALHGLEAVAAQVHPKARLIRYADDLVVIHKDLAVIEQSKAALAEWLAHMGLELKPSKTRITHTLHEHEGQVGFDFLGFNVRQHKVGKNRSGRLSPSKRLGFKTLIKPSQQAVKRHYQEIARIIEDHRQVSQTQLIVKLNRVTRGWARYYSSVTSKKVFSTLSSLMFVKLWRWAKRRHPRKSRKWIARKYWHIDKGRWQFVSPEGYTLFRHPYMPIKRHIKVKGRKSPYDGDWVYWVNRSARHPTIPTRIAKLMKRQAGRCAWCGLYFSSESCVEVDHVIPTRMGGHDGYDNWQLLHQHCHHQKTAQDRQMMQPAVLMTGAG